MQTGYDSAGRSAYKATDPNPQVYDLSPHPAAIPSNGNLVGYDEYHGGRGYPQFLTFHQSFTQDGANRLQNASDTGGWSRTFNYDPYGNMWATNVTGVATGAPSSDVYKGANNQVTNTSYDAAGNLKQVNGNTLFYDGESRQVAVTEPQAYGGGTEQYWFDGSGQRVAKAGPSGTLVYVYDVAGQLIAEYASVRSEHRGLAFFLGMLGPADILGRVQANDLANDQPVEQHLQRRQMLLNRRPRQAPLRLLHIGRNVNGRNRRQLP